MARILVVFLSHTCCQMHFSVRRTNTIHSLRILSCLKMDSSENNIFFTPGKLYSSMEDLRHVGF